MSLLRNAVTSIKLGVEDFRLAQHNEVRALSAIRNMTAGILLLFKVKLDWLSPAGSDGVFMKADLKPAFDADGRTVWKAKSKKTVDTSTLIQRLIDLGVTEVDWKTLRELVALRNDVEHYYSSSPVAGLLQVMSASFHLIQQFVPKYLNEYPIVLLGSETWQFLTDQETFYKAELASCQRDLAKIDWRSPTVAAAVPEMACTECQSKLIRPGDVGESHFYTDFICTRCSTRMAYDLVVEEVLAKVMFAEQYRAVTTGDEPPLALCGDCFKPTFIVSENMCGACHASDSAVGAEDD
jgi:hypothetical protein